ncbi:MAG: hypothetical protein AB7O52_14770 [Planctomycetota bacterium]
MSLLLILTSTLTLATAPEPPPRTTPAARVEFQLALLPSVPQPAAGHWLRLEEVAVPVRDPAGVWPLVRATILPTVGQECVTWGLVLHRLAGAGLPADRVGLAGPALCAFEREVSP